MKKILLALALCSSVAMAGPKGYQATGKVLSVSPDTIVIEKGKEKWEIGRDAATKTKGDIKVGDKVTAYYKMTATDIEVKK